MPRPPRGFVTNRRIRVPALLTRTEAVAAGFSTYDASGRGRLAEVLPGVYIHPTASNTLVVPEWTDARWDALLVRCAAIQKVRPDAVISHASAALLLGWPLPARMIGVESVDVLPQTHAVRRRGVRGHRPREVHSLERFGVRIAAHYEVLRQISGALGLREQVVLLDAILGTWHGPPETTREELAETIEAVSPFRGRADLRSALALARPLVGSPEETILRLDLVAAGLPEPVVQYGISDCSTVFHPDLCYPDQKIIIEYEGQHHRTDPVQWNLDIERERRLRVKGWEYVRVTKESNRRDVIAEVRRLLAAAGR